MSRAFFETVDDALHGFLPPSLRGFDSHRTSMNLKVWYDEGREHYEVQLVHGPALEVGFHAEHPKPDDNDAVIAHLLASEKQWRRIVGQEAQVGDFLGRQDKWRRVSETWPDPDLGDGDLVIEIATRLTDYITAIEPVRRRRSPRAT